MARIIEPKALYGQQEAAALVGVSVHTLIRWRRENRLQARKVGRRVFYLGSDILAMLEPESAPSQ